jgi:4-amino-4-deoxy-L-arabinose transferase-like glycosyltransferase
VRAQVRDERTAALFRPLLAIAAAAFLLRLGYALGVAPDLVALTDDFFYHLSALQLAHGHGYNGGLDAFLPGKHWPTASHPPLYSLALSLVVRLGGDTVDAMRVVGVVAGTATVVLVGLIVARLAGRRAALAAAAVCALWPSFVAADGALMSESLLGALVAGSLLQALRVLDRPSPGRMAILGLLVGAAALTRSEGLLLLPLLGAPLVIAARRRRLLLAAALIAGMLVVVAPWVARNWHVYGAPVYSTNEGTTLAGSNCRPTYWGPEIGGFVERCLKPKPQGANPATVSRERRADAVHYVRQHTKRAVVVVAARVGRLFGLYDLHDSTTMEGRDRTLQWVGLVLFYPLLVAGVAGAVVLARRRRHSELAVLLAPVAVSALTAMATYGLPRLRHIVEIALLVLAATAAAAVTQTSSRKTISVASERRGPSSRMRV